MEIRCIYVKIYNGNQMYLCKNIKWKLDVNEADGYYIKECY